ncbi:ParA family protein [Billgrantia ethanolica]|uniref:ParA family protein n=1 Tax=Billgrantia ethanolica TaxID=2733486 RepID=A0ABS9A961_9GAMM|nr:ParA family protein [Halomonas ethanolica]MCE8005329.1 ParA family protein [Halomonas ethanolica]
MRILSVLSTKGGVGKTTTTANLGGLLADAGFRVLLIDADSQPSLSSYFQLQHKAPGGFYELIALSETQPDRVISRTVIDGLDIVVSNDYQSQLPQLLLNAPDGRFRLSHLLRHGPLADYDVILIDTQGARSITLEAAVLASDHALSPITADLLSAREFVRGTIGMYDDLETLSQYSSLAVPPLSLLLNRLDETRNSQDLAISLRSMYARDGRVRVMDSAFRLLAAFKMAGAAGEPIHRYEPVKPYKRVTPAGADLIKAMAKELNPAWIDAIDAMPEYSRGGHGHEHH